MLMDLGVMNSNNYNNYSDSNISGAAMYSTNAFAPTPSATTTTAAAPTALAEKIVGGGGGGGGCGDVGLLKFNFQHLLNCTENFHEDNFTEPGASGRLLDRDGGGFGTVHLAVNISTEIGLAAVKRLKKSVDLEKEKFDLEMKILSQHRHENLVKLLGYSTGDGDDNDSNTRGELCLIYEYVSGGGNLEQKLERCRRREATMDIPQRLAVAIGVAKGIDYLHTAQLIHRDVKSPNVLLTSDSVPKVGQMPVVCGNGAVLYHSSILQFIRIGTEMHMQWRFN